MEKKLVYLTGFMGSGKSTIGPIVANTLGWEFIDLDQAIEKKERKKITEIFERLGENYFRNVESKTLSEISQGENAIVALGGGTIINNLNLDVVKKSGLLIYLKMSPESAFKRLKFKKDRPILNANGLSLQNKNEFIKYISDLMDKRIKFYEKADIIIDTDEVSIGFTVDKIARIIQKEIKVPSSNN